MAKLREQSEGTPRGSVSEFMGDEEVREASGVSDNKRESSSEGIRAIEPEGITLAYPVGENPVWPHFMKALTATQYALATSKNTDVEKLRIAKATVPANALPSDYDTGHGGIIIEQGDAFTARLTDGRLLTATQA